MNVSTEAIEACAADWIARRDGGRWTDAQQLELEGWLNASTAHRVAYLRLEAAWLRSDRLAALQVPKIAPAARPAAPSWWPAWANSMQFGWKIAAGFLLALGLASSSGWWWSSHEDPGYQAALGERESVELPDGSRLLLNTDTQVRTSLGAKRRSVWLDRGEAYFEVAHDASRPFVVEAGAQRITVLGTKFSVRLLETGQVQVKVLDGRVRVEPKDASEANATASRVLTRNEVAVAEPDHLLVSRRTAEQIGSDLSWRQGRLVLDQMTLAQAAAEFNRYNHKQLVVEDAAAAGLRIGGSFEVGNVEAFARLLREGFGLQVHSDAKEIKISS